MKSQSRIGGSGGKPLAICRLGGQLHAFLRHRPNACRIVDEIVMTRMQRDNVDFGAVAADPMELLDDLKIYRVLRAEMLEDAIQAHLIDRIIGPWPRKLLEIDSLIGVAERTVVDVVPTQKFLGATAEIQAHHSLRKPENRRCRTGVPACARRQNLHSGHARVRFVKLVY